MSQDTLKEVLKKYSLMFPVPMNVQRELCMAKKETIKYILKEKREYSFYVKLVLSLYYIAESLGIDFSYKKSKALAGALSFSAAVLLTAVLFFSVRPYFYEEAFRGAAAVCVFGDVKIFQGNAERSLDARDIVRDGDEIRTGKRSFAIIQISNKMLFRVQENSIVKASAIITSGRNEFTMSRGVLLSKIKKMGKDEAFIIKTPTMVASVRGTAFSVSADGDKTLLSVKEGTVKVEHSEKEYRAGKGKSIIISRTAAEKDITVIDNLEIKRISLMPFLEKTVTMTDQEAALVLKEVLERDRLIDQEIAALEKRDIGERLPQTLEEIRAKYGRIDTIYLFNGKVYRGAILYRGASMKVIIPKRYIYIPAKDVKYTR